MRGRRRLRKKIARAEGWESDGKFMTLRGGSGPIVRMWRVGARLFVAKSVGLWVFVPRSWPEAPLRLVHYEPTFRNE